MCQLKDKIFTYFVFATLVGFLSPYIDHNFFYNLHSLILSRQGVMFEMRVLY